MTEDMDGKTIIVNGRAVLGIELGSTRIKAVLLDEGLVSLAHGSHSWENKFVDGLWTYSLDDVWAGLQDCYANLRRDVMEKYGVEITRLRAVGFSGMMHGFLMLWEYFDVAKAVLEEIAGELKRAFAD